MHLKRKEKETLWKSPSGNNAYIICHQYFKWETATEEDVEHSGSYQDAR